MILDTLDNLSKYSSLNPLFPAVVEFLSKHPLDELPLGKTNICGDDLFVNIVDSAVKAKEQAKIETHIQMIDIQIPISDSEEHGYTPLSKLPQAEYNEMKDISFYPGLADTYFTVFPGQFVIYFPWDGHAPAITSTGLCKAIFKVKVSK